MDPNVRRITWVARKCVFFGLAFLAVGLLVFFLLSTSPLAPAEMAIFAGVLVFLGAIFVCVRVGVVVDRRQRVITTWWGLLVPFHKTEHLFSQAHFVTISREERSAGKGTSEVFPVRLESLGTDAITIHAAPDHEKARHLAEDVAKFVHLGIRDRSSEEEVVREAGALDQSLQQRLRRARRPMPLPAQPPGARAIFNYGRTPATTTIEIPPIGHSARWFLLAMLTAGLMTIFIEFAMWRDWYQEESHIGIRAPLTFLLVLGILLPLVLRAAILRERLVVSPDGLVVTRCDILGTKTTRLTSGEIEEVEVIEARYGMSGGYAAVTSRTGLVVIIRSDRGSIALGATLSNPEELKWLSDVLVHVLTSVSRDA